MRQFFLSTLIFAACAGGLVMTKAHAADEPAKDAKKPAEAPTKGEKKPAETAAKDEKNPAEESRVKTDANGNTVIAVDDETQKRIGLKVEPLTATELTPEVKGYGSVVDPSPLTVAINDLATAEAAYNASSKELERLKTLKEQGNASDRVLQAAEAAAVRDQLLIQSAKDRLTLAWGKAIAEQKDLPEFVKLLTSLDSALVRINLAGGENLDSNPTSARILKLSGNPIEAQFLSIATTVDPQTQGQGFIFIVKNNEARLRPGEAVTGYLKVAGEPIKGMVIPREAIVRSEGKGWAYVQTGETVFTRREVPLDHLIEKGWFVTEGFAPNDRLVVAAAQALLSEERKGLIKAD
ncbi:efflux RND transporter periplasmic adaptor subunit [Pedosphaera parvula]|uniref:RND efflux pump membrane fusion protein barrel-sandwich domain-containing protein n=1 Tax=Pedosphaera parvula (strain Ellin514) TaxID=320771 RepID=B9XPS0_PEDPL|nr:hypothetical protein [Pedosphaera parvula]EEF58193.1 hypothetical protein Cflav_PD1393 [Pedosphaera parvula Ellin514]